MIDFESWVVAQNTEDATAEIAKRVEQMQQLYAEAVLLARTFDIRLQFDLENPDEAKGGHNQDHYVYWSASAQYC